MPKQKFITPDPERFTKLQCMDDETVRYMIDVVMTSSTIQEERMACCLIQQQARIYSTEYSKLFDMACKYCTEDMLMEFLIGKITREREREETMMREEEERAKDEAAFDLKKKEETKSQLLDELEVNRGYSKQRLESLFSKRLTRADSREYVNHLIETGKLLGARPQGSNATQWVRPMPDMSF